MPSLREIQRGLSAATIFGDDCGARRAGHRRRYDQPRGAHGHLPQQRARQLSQGAGGNVSGFQAAGRRRVLRCRGRCFCARTSVDSRRRQPLRRATGTLSRHLRAGASARLPAGCRTARMGDRSGGHRGRRAAVRSRGAGGRCAKTPMRCCASCCTLRCSSWNRTIRSCTSGRSTSRSSKVGTLTIWAKAAIHYSSSRGAGGVDRRTARPRRRRPASRLCRAAPLGAAASRATDAEPSFDLPAALRRHVANQVLVGFDAREPSIEESPR